MWTERITLSTLYDFDYTLYRFSFDPIITVDREERSVKVPVVFLERKHIVEVKAVGTTEKPAFIITSDEDARKDSIISYIYDLFQWDFDLNKVGEHFKGTNLEELFHTYPGTPIVREFDLFYCLMKTIIHQQLNMKFAYVLSTRFIENFGEKINGVWFYPSPEKVANIEIAALRELQFSGRKAEYVIDTSKMIANGEVNLEEMGKKTDQEILQEMVKIRGVGPWTVENWMLFGLGRKNLFPKADIGIQNAVKRLLAMDRKPTIESLTDMSKLWGPYRSYASLTLWRSIE
ncbi:DNA-3-methyladenine glycosylase family protein [Oceanobacillus bengalensis]|uniref:DNA-3-methyladenine glycosylase II n=1 Tax=Oceanobacillus bengalensis TaxID=1435466 RepID=A0A494YW42_9BACI|nr:DNA-3-methyladenine glycosylase [Oceanobacillus bengalensis]RKQ14379.1 DNA-3-methyladenine glycosylase 2 family protein [Oceanobacillus bengalensis]